MIQNSQQLNQIRIPQGHSLFVQPGSMVAFGSVSMNTQQISRSVFGSMSGSFWSGESMFHNRFSANQRRDGWVALDGDLDIIECQLQPYESLTTVSGALVARDEEIELATETQGISGLFSGTGMVTQKLTNTSDRTKRVFLETPKGSLKEIKINEHSGVVSVDANNIVGYTNGLSINTIRLGGLLSCCASDENLVNEFRGTGSVFIRVGGKNPSLQAPHSQQMRR